MRCVDIPTHSVMKRTFLNFAVTGLLFAQGLLVIHELGHSRFHGAIETSQLSSLSDETPHVCHFCLVCQTRQHRTGSVPLVPIATLQQRAIDTVLSTSAGSLPLGVRAVYLTAPKTSPPLVS